MGLRTMLRAAAPPQEQQRPNDADRPGDKPSGGSDADGDAISVDAQAGVQQAEATTKVWTVKHIWLAYALIWFIMFVDSTQQSMGRSFKPYVTSSFNKHSMTATTDIMANIMGGVFKLPLSKILDIWGRPQGLGLMAAMVTLGLAMMAGCNSITTYSAAQVFYWIGMNGVAYSLSVFTADTSALKSRAFVFAYIWSPYIITVWLSGPLATKFLDGPGFRWGYGIFAIITPFMVLPLIALFTYNYNKAKAMGLLPPRAKSGRTPLQSIKHYAIEFDVVGILLLSAGLSLILLPFGIMNRNLGNWKSAKAICMLVFGGLLIISFGLWERFLAPVKFIPYKLLLDRTIMGALVLVTSISIGSSIWKGYFDSYLQVVNGLSVTNTTYVTRIFIIGSCFWGLVIGVLIRVTGRFKWAALSCGIPLTILGTGLMIHFLRPGGHIGWVVMCQIFIAIAGGTNSITEQMAVMASVTHQEVAVTLAVLAAVFHVAGAVGHAISAALWTRLFYSKLSHMLPAESIGNLSSIYGNIKVQLSYPLGTPTRDAIITAYAETEKLMLIAGLCFMFVALGAAACWRDIRLKDFKQTKGLVV